MLNIKKYRERLGISQAELARRIGLPRQTLNNYELGKREADYETLLKLSEELNTTVQDLLTDKELEAVPSLTTQPEYRGFNILDKKNVFMVPIFQSVSAGFGAYADDQICGYEPVPARSKREAEESIAIAVHHIHLYTNTALSSCLFPAIFKAPRHTLRGLFLCAFNFLNCFKSISVLQVSDHAALDLMHVLR